MAGLMELIDLTVPSPPQTKFSKMGNSQGVQKPHKKTKDQGPNKGQSATTTPAKTSLKRSSTTPADTVNNNKVTLQAAAHPPNDDDDDIVEVTPTPVRAKRAAAIKATLSFKALVKPKKTRNPTTKVDDKPANNNATTTTTGTVKPTPATIKTTSVPTPPKPTPLKDANAPGQKPQTAVKVLEDDDTDDDDTDDDESDDVIPLPKKQRLKPPPPVSNAASTMVVAPSTNNQKVAVQSSKAVNPPPAVAPKTAIPVAGGGVIGGVASTVSKPPAIAHSIKSNVGNQVFLIKNPALQTPGARVLVANLASRATQNIHTTAVKPSSAVTLQLPPLIDLSPQQQPKPPKYVSEEAAKILQEISAAHFTTTFTNSGKFTAEVLPSTSEEYDTIRNYIIQSQAHDFGVKMHSILKVSRTSDLPSPIISVPREESSEFTMMLFHGTKRHVVASILEHGFRCPNAPTGQMFGTGVYFADRISKSAQYIAPQFRPPAGTVGYIFICEVQLGKIYNAKLANHSYKSPPDITRKNGTVVPCDSVMCTGANVPNRDLQKKIGDVYWPLGPTVKNTKFPSYTVLYNEFIVYQPDRIKIKYLVKVEITPRPHLNYD